MTAEQATQSCISHTTAPPPLEQTVQKLRARIRGKGDKPNATVTQQLAVIDALMEFGLGHFLLTHRGLNGPWTRYVAGLDPRFGLKNGVNPAGNPLPELERWILSRSRAAYILPQRMRAAQEILQPMLRDGSVFASVPCGAMDDLLGLDDTGRRGIHLVGIDIDTESLQLARENAAARGLSDKVELLEADAWHLGVQNRFDALVCHGLTGYEPNAKRVQDLYAGFRQALKPGGIFITQFSTPPPEEDPDSSWDMTHIDTNDLCRDELIFKHVLQLKPISNRRTEQHTSQLLQRAGFTSVQIHRDRHGICPTAVAKKRADG